MNIIEKKIVFFIFLSFQSLHLRAQDISLDWVGLFKGGDNYTYAFDINGNKELAIAGSISGTVDFNPGVSVNNLTNPGGSSASYVCKLDSNGNYVWALRYAGPSGSFIANDLKYDADGNIIICGSLFGTLDMDLGASVTNLTSNGGQDAVVIKLYPNGNFIWAKKVGAGSTDRAVNLAVDDARNIYVSGVFNGVVDFDPNLGVENRTVTGQGVFVWKLDMMGNYVFSSCLAGNSSVSMSSNVTGIRINRAGDLIISGSFADTVDFDPGPNANLLISNITLDSWGNPFHVSDLFFWKLTSNGDFIWAKQIGANNGTDFTYLNLDDQDNIYGLGVTNGVLDFDPSTSVYNLSSNYDNTFILKLDSDGDFQNVKLVPSESTYSLSFDQQNNMYLSGNFSGQAKFPIGSDTLTLNSNGFDNFLLKMDHNFNNVWVKSFGGSGNQFYSLLLIDSADNLYISRGISGAMDFDPSAGERIENSTNTSSWNTYVAKYSPCTNSFSSINASACDNYVLNGFTYTSSGQYTQLLQNTAGCDSTITLYLEIRNSTSNFINASECGSYTLNGQAYNSSGIYTQVLQNAVGCDSTITLQLFIKNSSSSQITETACDSYTLNGQVYISSGNYTQQLQNAVGCDSTIHLNLSIKQSSSSQLTVSECDSYTLNGQTYTASGTYTQVVQNAIGCDSTITLNLTINQSSSAQLNEVICSGSSYFLNGTSYVGNVQAPGDQFTINQVLQNSVGCDSLLTVTVTYNPTVTNSQISICQGESALIHGFYRSTAGLYSQRFSAANGCDSISNVTLVVKSLPLVDAGQSFLACSGSNVVLSGSGANTYSWSGGVLNGVPFTAPSISSTYAVIGTSLEGCSSTDIITIYINQSPTVSAGPDQDYCLGTLITLTASSDSTCIWDNGVINGVPFNPNGQTTFTVTIIDFQGCTGTDQVTIYYLNPSSSQITETACDNYTINGQTFNATGIYTQVIPNAVGCDSTITLDLTIKNSTTTSISEVACNEYSAPDGQIFTQTGVYTSVIPNSVQCDSIITLNLTIVPTVAPEICMVSVDSAGINNVIYWDKTVYPSADTFYVYREIQNNNYQIIGTLPSSATSQFVDTVRALYFPNTGDPKISSSRYKLAFRDTCGNLSSLGRYHRTMFLQDQMNGNFNWNHYEIENETSPVAALTTYYFLRDNNLDGIFESVIGSTTSNLATDPSYSSFQNTADWRIETSWSIQCEGTKKLTNEKSLLTTSKSNRRNYQTNGLKENVANELGIRCYPNVVTQTLYIMSSNLSLVGDLTLLDLSGKIVLEQNLSGDTQLDVTNLAKGTYFLKIESKGTVYSQKLIKN